MHRLTKNGHLINFAIADAMRCKLCTASRAIGSHGVRASTFTQYRQLALQGAGSSLPPDAAAAAAAATAAAEPAAMQQQWAQQLQARTPGAHLLPAAAIAGASPLAPSSLPPTGLLPGAPQPRKRVTGKQIVAERRREREAARRQAAVEARVPAARPV